MGVAADRLIQKIVGMAGYFRVFSGLSRKIIIEDRFNKRLSRVLPQQAEYFQGDNDDDSSEFSRGRNSFSP